MSASGAGTSSEDTGAERVFSPAFQETFWRELHPDLRSFLSLWENSERWAWQYEEYPDFFHEAGQLLPYLRALPLDEITPDLVNALIELLSTMPMRYAVSAVSWLDHEPGDGEAGPAVAWGVLCFQQASELAAQPQDTPMKLWARVFCERIRVMVRTRLATALFSQQLLRREIA